MKRNQISISLPPELIRVIAEEATIEFCSKATIARRIIGAHYAARGVQPSVKRRKVPLKATSSDYGHVSSATEEH